MAAVNNTAAMAWRIQSYLITMDSRLQGTFITCQGMMSPHLSITNLNK